MIECLSVFSCQNGIRNIIFISLKLSLSWNTLSSRRGNARELQPGITRSPPAKWPPPWQSIKTDSERAGEGKATGTGLRKCNPYCLLTTGLLTSPHHALSWVNALSMRGPQQEETSVNGQCLTFSLPFSPSFFLLLFIGPLSRGGEIETRPL